MRYQRYSYIIFLGISAIFAPTAYAANDAEQIKFSNNQTVTAKVSLDDPNRLFVRGDEIQSISCQGGFCVNKLNPETGDALLSLGSAAFSVDAFTMYITTKSGRQFSVVVTPFHAVGQTIEFIPQGGGSIKAKAFEAKSNYTSMLATLIKDMINYDDTFKAPEGYSAQDIDAGVGADTNAGDSDLLIFPVRVFQGDRLMGMVYAVKNVTKSPLKLTSKQFYQRGILASALSTEKLKPQQVALLYQVSIREGVE